MCIIFRVIMSVDSAILKSTAQRLGITSAPVLKKAEEYLRLFHTKAGVLKTSNDVAKTVFCLNLAAANQGIIFDNETAVKLSGVKKSVYQSHIHTIQKVLGLDRSASIAELCVQLGCTSVKDIAEEILNQYKLLDHKIKDFEHPQYATAAIYAACKAKNIKIDKGAFVSSSHLKPSQWKEFSTEFLKFTEQGIGHSMKSSMKSKKTDFNFNPDLHSDNMDAQDKSGRNEENVEEVEDYEIWKERILREAYAALKKTKNTANS